MKTSNNFDSNNEVTENLIEEKSSSVSPVKSFIKKYKVAFIILIAIAVAALAYLAYYLYRNNQYNSLVNEGNEFIKSEEYSKATESFNKAIKIFDNRDSAYRGLALSTYMSDNYSQANSALKKFEELNGASSEVADYKAGRANRGNSNVNLGNGGFIADFLGKGFLLQQDGESQYVWDLKEGPMADPYYKFSNSETRYSEITGASLWDNRVYFLSSNKLNYMDLNTNELVEVGLETSYFYIYEDQIYYVPYLRSQPDIGISVCDLNGNNIQTALFVPNSHYSITKFIIDNDNFYIGAVDYTNQSEGVVYKCPLNSSSLEELNRFNNLSYVNSIFTFGNKLYYTCYSYNMSQSTENKMVLNFSKIYCNDIDSKQPVNIESPENVESVATDGNNLFYVSGGKIYQSDFQGSSAKEIGSVPQISNSVDVKAGATTSSINITDDYIFVCSSVLYSLREYNYGRYGQFIYAPLNDVSNFNDLSFEQFKS